MRFEDLPINSSDCPPDKKAKFFVTLTGWRDFIKGRGQDITPKETYESWINSLNYPVFYNITFTKKDGTERTLFVTTSIPADKLPSGKGVENKDILRVFVHDLQEWRSIRYDSMISLSFEDA